MNTRNPVANFDRIFGEMHKEFARNLIGYETVVDGLRNALGAYDSYPPYNIEKIDENHYEVSLALAGFGDKDVQVTKEGDMLTISGNIVEETEGTEERNFLYRGIATRAFTRKVQLATDIEVTGAEMENGMLTVKLERIVPEEKQPKTIKIKSK